MARSGHKPAATTGQYPNWTNCTIKSSSNCPGSGNNLPFCANGFAGWRVRRAHDRRRLEQPEDATEHGERGGDAEYNRHNSSGTPQRIDATGQETGEREQADGHPERAHNTPLVDGTPPARGSCSTAARSARATALYWASVMWCGSRPYSTRTCRAIWAWKASDSNTWRLSTAG